MPRAPHSSVFFQAGPSSSRRTGCTPGEHSSTTVSVTTYLAWFTSISMHEPQAIAYVPRCNDSMEMPLPTIGRNGVLANKKQASKLTWHHMHTCTCTRVKATTYVIFCRVTHWKRGCPLNVNLVWQTEQPSLHGSTWASKPSGNYQRPNHIRSLELSGILPKGLHAQLCMWQCTSRRRDAAYAITNTHHKIT